MEPRPYAGMVTRAIALVTDAVLINVIAAITGAVIGLIGSLLGIGKPGIVAAVTGGFLWLGWTALYFVAFWTVTGQTPGARLLGIRVLTPDGRRVGIIGAMLRFAVMMVALLPLGAGFITVLFDDRRRGPHDMVAGTVVRWTSAESAAVAPEMAAVLAADPAAGATAPATVPDPSPTDPPPAPLGGLPGS